MRASAASPAASTPGTSMSCTASPPSSRPTASGPRKRWACATSKTWQVNAGWVLAAIIAPTSRHGPGSAGCTTANSATRTRTPSATGSGTCQPAWPATPGSAPSPSAPTGHGKTNSWPAGSGSAHCQHPPDQHKRPQRQEAGTPRRGRSRCAPGHTGRTMHHPPRRQTDMMSKNRLQHDQ